MKRLSPEESIEWIASRRSVFPKEFEDGLVSKEEVEKLLEAARFAPTHKLTEPWRFVVFMGKQKEQLIRIQQQAWTMKHGNSEESIEKVKKFEMIGQKASAVIGLVMRRDDRLRVPVDEELWAVASAIQNIHLHASSLNIGGYWSTGASNNLPEIRLLLNLGDKDVQMGWFYLGRYNGVKQLNKERRPLSEIVEWKV